MRYTKLLRLVSILCLIFLAWAGAPSTSQTSAAHETETHKAPAQDARVHGILLSANGLPQDDTEVLLVEAQVWDLSGKPVTMLPAKGLSVAGVIGDDSGAPVVKGKSRTKGGGRFEFRTTPGRYGVAVSAGASGCV